jgi:hypothetical protein
MGSPSISTVAAAEFRREIADLVAQRGKQVGAAIDENRHLAAIMSELQGGLGHRSIVSLGLAAKQEPA